MGQPAPTPQTLNPDAVEKLGIKEFNADDYIKTPEEREAYDKELKSLEGESHVITEPLHGDPVEQEKQLDA